MATLNQEIVEKFLAELSEGKHLGSEQITELRALLERNKKPKAEEFVKVFTLPVGGDLK